MVFCWWFCWCCWGVVCCFLLFAFQATWFLLAPRSGHWSIGQEKWWIWNRIYVTISILWDQHGVQLKKFLYFEWSPPWHFKTATWDSMSAWSCRMRVVRHTTYLLKPVTLNFTDWLEAIFWHFFWRSFWHSFWHPVWHSFCHILLHSFWHSFWHIFWHSVWHVCHIGWGLGGNTGRRGSRLRSGREHWAAGNTGRGCSRVRLAATKEEEEEKEKEGAD